MAETKPTFPKHFLWGASTAAHQIEGNLHNQWTVWELENARALAAAAEYQIGDFESWPRIKDEATNPHNYVSGVGADHANRYKEDFDLLEQMNMNAFRFSIEWSRIEPEEGRWDAAAIAYYHEYLRELKRRGITPVVTLFHFSLPVWFADKGGFTKRSNIKYFVRYVDKVMQELGSLFSIVITVNEPEVYGGISYFAQMFPPAEHSVWKTWRVVVNLATAHNRAAKLIHKQGRRHKVSMAKHSLYFYAGDNAWVTRLSAHIAQWLEDDYYLKKVVKHCDFIGLNYYQSMRVYGYRIHNPEGPFNDLNWVMAPSDLEFVLERLHEKYKLPILITENGLADGEDQYRKWWIQESLKAIQSAMKRGVTVQGYLHWSLLDNFEWAYGFWPRFGLVKVDYKTGKRTLRPSAVWFGSVIKKLRGI